MKLLVFGQTGQVAQELHRAAPGGWKIHFAGRAEADLEHPGQCAALIRAQQPQAVINAAAYTAVDRAEEEEALARRINADAPAAMADAAGKLGIPLLHISTDYVFDGGGNAAFRPGDPTGPIGAYGRSKLAGEQAVLSAGGHALVMRTSWVFSGHGQNFVRTMLRLGAEKERLNVVADQIGGPTPAAAIARALLTCADAMVRGQAGGLYHFAGTPVVSWAQFAQHIMQAADLDCAIDFIDSASYPTPAKRPGNSRLDCAAILQDFGIECPDWRDFLPAIIAELRQ